MLARRPGASAFLQTRRFLIRYDVDRPVDTPAKERAARVIAAHLERFGWAPGTRRGAAKAPPPVVLGPDDVVRLVEEAAGEESGS